jgi:hypothetical protein
MLEISFTPQLAKNEPTVGETTQPIPPRDCCILGMMLRLVQASP